MAARKSSRLADRSLALFLLAAFVFCSPFAIQILQSAIPWYAVYAAWLALIAVCVVVNHATGKDDA